MMGMLGKIASAIKTYTIGSVFFVILNRKICYSRSSRVSCVAINPNRMRVCIVAGFVVWQINLLGVRARPAWAIFFFFFPPKLLLFWCVGSQPIIHLSNIKQRKEGEIKKTEDYPCSGGGFWLITQRARRHRRCCCDGRTRRRFRCSRDKEAPSDEDQGGRRRRRVSRALTTVRAAYRGNAFAARGGRRGRGVGPCADWCLAPRQRRQRLGAAVAVVVVVVVVVVSAVVVVTVGVATVAPDARAECACGRRRGRCTAVAARIVVAAVCVAAAHPQYPLRTPGVHPGRSDSAGGAR